LGQQLPCAFQRFGIFCPNGKLISSFESFECFLLFMWDFNAASPMLLISIDFLHQEHEAHSGWRGSCSSHGAYAGFLHHCIRKETLPGIIWGNYSPQAAVLLSSNRYSAAISAHEHRADVSGNPIAITGNLFITFIRADANS
jgi:hypothetical protein